MCAAEGEDLRVCIEYLQYVSRSVGLIILPFQHNSTDNEAPPVRKSGRDPVSGLLTADSMQITVSVPSIGSVHFYRYQLYASVMTSLSIQIS